MARILIADDALFMRTVVKRALVAGGHEVVAEAENGQQAFDAFQRLKPELTLLDITMPEVDGLAALKLIMGADPAARVIMCTAIGQQDKMREAVTSGARDYVIKPFTPDKLIDAVTRALS